MTGASGRVDSLMKGTDFMTLQVVWIALWWGVTPLILDASGRVDSLVEGISSLMLQVV